ncbi:MAG: tetratricopeptide repeat protein, partial [Sphingobacteriaceae bacterium]|nr:tetratricopeptide repeat protein [Cytophagaceae bacterium]
YYSQYGSLLADQRGFGAVEAYQKAIVFYLQTGDTTNAGIVYNKLGYFYLKAQDKVPEAFRAFKRALILIRKQRGDLDMEALILSNLGYCYERQGAYKTAFNYYQRSLNTFPIHFTDSLPERNPPGTVIRLAYSKESLLSVIQDKADAWLAWAKSSGNRAHLHHALATYRTADQMIDFMRWEHTGEESKRFWREKTHRLYENAIETCHRLNRPEDAFYFFEKSRAALLSDRLNELGASQLLNPADQKREADLQKTVGELRQKVGEAKPGDKTGDSLRQALLSEEETQTSFVRSLETRNPAYFRYRYDTSAVRLQTVREKLLTEGQTLLEYFVGDSAVYALTVTATSAKLTRLAVKDYAQTTRQLLTLSADAAALNQRFPAFLKTSHQLFRELFAPLGVPKGRVIVSPDGAILPLELLSRSPSRPDWLLRDYAFSYTYSAQFLIKQASRRPLVSGSFLGLAPVSFASGQPSLGGSDASLSTLGGGFFSPTLLSGSTATKRAFLRELPRHRVALLYAHAQADSSGREPEIFF